MVDEFACPHCRKNLGSAMEPPGTTLMCPYCKQFFTITAGPESRPGPSDKDESADIKSDDLGSTEGEKTVLESAGPKAKMADLHLAESTGVKLPPPPTPISRPALTAQAPLTQETFPYILPDLPRSSVAATTGYFGIFFGVLVLLIAAIFIVEKLKPDWIEFVPFLPELLDMLPPQVTTYGLITASGCGVYSMAAFIGGIGVLKEKRWARILMWLLGLGAVSILILLGAYIVDPNIISHLLSALTSGQPEPNVI